MSKGDTTHPTTSQNPSVWHPSWLNKACTTRKDSEPEWLAKDNPETNPITIKPETVSHVAEQFSWVPLPYCSPAGCPFPVKSLSLSAHVSFWTIHFKVLDKKPVLCPGTGPPSRNKTRTAICSQIHNNISLHPGILNGNSNGNFWCLTYRTEVLLGTFSQLGLQMCCVRGLPSAV